MAEHDFGSRAVPCLDTSALAGLAERVAAATGADRELDEAIWAALGQPTSQAGANYTASLDAALALVERVLPGWEWHVLFAPSHGDDGYSYAGLTPPDGGRGPSIAQPGKRPALALLSALLAALAAGANLSEREGDGATLKTQKCKRCGRDPSTVVCMEC